MKSLASNLTRLLVPEYRLPKPPSKMVAVVVPVSNRPHLTPEEEVSMRHLIHHLGRYDKYLIAPPNLKISFAGFKVRHFSKRFFGSMRAHNHMLYTPSFFKAFEDYKYILLYHLDALVFSDELIQWCELDVDYIGAPWVPCEDLPWVKEPSVGNGGFTLYKVESVIKVLQNRYRMEPGQYWEDKLLPLYNRLDSVLKPFKKLWCDEREGITRPSLRKKLQRLERAQEYLQNNDLFFSFEGANYFPEFKIPDWKTALRFAFETPPRLCFELNGGKLPFGCHAWTKYDRSFWEPYLLKPRATATSFPIAHESVGVRAIVPFDP